MAKKQPVDEVVEDVESVAEEPPRETHDPEKFVCLDGAYVESADAATKERRILHGGANYEHVGEDADGVWTYRRM